MSSDEDDNVKLYNPLERNLKRQRVFVTLSSSESEGDEFEEDFELDDTQSGSSASPFRKRLRSREGQSPARASAAARAVVLDDEKVYGDDLLTAEEKEKERQRGIEIDREIEERLAKDQVLNQTRAVMRQAEMQLATEPANKIITLDSDEDDDVVLLSTTRPVNGATSSHTPTSNGAASQDKGQRITLHVRSNGSRTDAIIMFSREPFSILYEKFCDLHGLPYSAVQMSLDGDNLSATDTPQANDLDSGDLIDAKVDFSLADAQKKKRLVRLILRVEGRKPEKFRIDTSSTLDKLCSAFCKRHQITDPDDVEMSIRGDRLRLSETIDYYELIDDDVINVEIKNFVDPAAIELNVRYDDKTTKPHSVVPTHKVASLIAQVADHLHVEANRISLRLDGEAMEANTSLQYYDLEGGEIIDVKVRS